MADGDPHSLQGPHAQQYAPIFGPAFGHPGRPAAPPTIRQTVGPLLRDLC